MREITLREIILVRELASKLESAIRDGARPLFYEPTLDDLVRTARPEMHEAWQRQQEPALFPENPAGDCDPRTPDAAATGASSSPPAGSGPSVRNALMGVVTREELRDALAALYHEMMVGTAQLNWRDWANEIYRYITRHAERQSDVRTVEQALFGDQE